MILHLCQKRRLRYHRLLDLSAFHQAHHLRKKTTQLNHEIKRAINITKCYKIHAILHDVCFATRFDAYGGDVGHVLWAFVRFHSKIKYDLPRPPNMYILLPTAVAVWKSRQLAGSP